jgi:hypothetical protein
MNFNGGKKEVKKTKTVVVEKLKKQMTTEAQLLKLIQQTLLNSYEDNHSIKVRINYLVYPFFFEQRNGGFVLSAFWVCLLRYNQYSKGNWDSPFVL